MAGLPRYAAKPRLVPARLELAANRNLAQDALIQPPPIFMQMREDEGFEESHREKLAAPVEIAEASAMISRN